MRSLLRPIVLSHLCKCAQAWIEDPQNLAMRTPYLLCSWYDLSTSKIQVLCLTWITIVHVSPFRGFPILAAHSVICGYSSQPCIGYWQYIRLNIDTLAIGYHALLVIMHDQ